MTLISRNAQPFKMNPLLDLEQFTSKKGLRSIHNPNPNLRSTQLFQKYFPKYLKKITIESRNGSYFSKLKRTKIIQEFESPRLFFSRRDWKILFHNKSKSLKALHNYSQSILQFENKIKFFPNISNIKLVITALSPFRAQLVEDKSLNKACKMMRRLKSLKSLEISRFSKQQKSLLSQLNSSPYLLSSLKILSISFQREVSNDHILLEILTENKNLLKYITKLNLGSLCSPHHYQSFQALANSCPILTNLSFEFCCRPVFFNLVGMKRFSDDRFTVETGCLGALRTFSNLKALNIDIADAFYFLKAFALPSSVQYLRLNFEEVLSKEVMLKLKSDFVEKDAISVFEENQTLLSFYERFRELICIETFEVLFSQDSDEEAYKHENYLCQNILKRISCIKSLSLKFSPRCWELNKPCEVNLKDTYLSTVLASCPSETLETLEIGDTKIFYSNFDLSALRNKFTKLSTLKIDGRFDDEDYASKNGVFSFLKEVISLGESIKMIKITTVGSSKIESLVTFAKQMERINMPKTLRIDVDVILCDGANYSKSDCNEAIIELSKIQEENLRDKRFYAWLFCPVSARFIKDFLKAYGKKFEKIKIYDCLQGSPG